MPCIDTGREHEELRIKQRRLDHVTRLLCELTKRVKTAGLLQLLADTELTQWMSEHEKVDQERIRREALSKLTAEEKKALGL